MFNGQSNQYVLQEIQRDHLFSETGFNLLIQLGLITRWRLIRKITPPLIRVSGFFAVL